MQFQAALCYLPKLIWNNSEGGLMSAISSGLNVELYKEDDIATRKKTVIEYVVTHIRVSKVIYFDCNNVLMNF